MSIKQEVEEGISPRQKKCIVCEQPAEFCMRGIPENTYCRECAKDYFKFLNYLDSLK